MTDTRHLVVEFENCRAVVVRRLTYIDGKWVRFSRIGGEWTLISTPSQTSEQVLAHCKSYYLNPGLVVKINGVDYRNLPGQDGIILNA